MSNVKLKHNLNCCLAKSTKELVKNSKSLIVDKDLIFKNKLLFLYSFVLENSECDAEISSDILHHINSLCGTDTCTNCKSTEIVVETWIPDASNYQTIWKVADYECEPAPTKWVVADYICEPKATSWVVIDACCEQRLIWQPVDFCCEQQCSTVIICKPKCSNVSSRLRNVLKCKLKRRYGKCR